MPFFLVVVIAYLLGSIPFGYILVKLFLKQDIRSTGSGNIGATNVARSGAKGLAIATLLLDAGKGILAIWIAKRLVTTHGPYWEAVSLIGLVAVIGHMFPIWLRFRGGKGVATGVGVFTMIAPYSILVVLTVFIVVVAFTKYVSLGAMIASALFPVLAWQVDGFFRWPIAVVFMSLTSLLIILKHHENIRRLLAGTESKFGGKKSIPPPNALEKQA